MSGSRLLLALAVPVLLSQSNFRLEEMDFHLHSGVERPVPMDDWLNLAVRDGRRVVALLDHLELYRKTPEEYAAWRITRKIEQPTYGLGAGGHRQVMADFDRVIQERKDLVVFKGWEISETELDTGIEPAPMAMAEIIGWHISPNHAGTPPDGKKLLHRARQVLEVQKRFPVPMVLLHPFPMRMEHIRRKAMENGRSYRSIPVDEYRFFQPGEAEELAALLRGTSVYIEISRDTERYWNDPVCREAFIADMKPLVAGGVQFTISTDAHGVADQKRTFRPAGQYCEALGCTPANTNTIIRELLARRGGKKTAE